MTRAEQQQNIIKQFYIRNTKIKIADNYCASMTKERVDYILRKIAYEAQLNISAAASK